MNDTTQNLEHKNICNKKSRMQIFMHPGFSYD